MSAFSLTHLTQEPTQPTTDSSKPPLLLLLHGVRSNEQDLFGLASYLDKRLFVVSARAPRTLGYGQYGWYEVAFTPEGPVGNAAQAEESRQTLLRFVDEVTAAYPVDPKQVYLMGFSQGAIMSLYAALTHPEKFAGIVAMSGRLLPEAVDQRVPDEALKDFPILAVHGTRDSVLPISEGRRIQTELSKLPVDLTYKEYNMAHEVSPESLTDINNWLTEQLNQNNEA